jgi:hypothetical protein
MRVQDGLRVARKSVQRPMRENALLSPHRSRPSPEEDRTLIARYETEWLVEKNGHLSPTAIRCQHQLAAMLMAA